MKNLIMMIGLPASGKSTFRNYICDKYDSTVVISSDDCIEKEGNKKSLTYNQVFHDKDVQSYCKRYTEEIFINAIENNKDILIDRTNLTIKSRRKIISRLPSDYKIHYVWFNLPRCFINHNMFERYMNTEKIISKNIVDDMENWFQEPLEHEYHTLTIIDENNNNYDFEME